MLNFRSGRKVAYNNKYTQYYHNSHMNINNLHLKQKRVSKRKRSMKKQEQIDALRTEIERIKKHIGLSNNIHIHHGNLNHSEKPNSCEQYELPDFVPDWKDAPEDAVCVAMDFNGMWYWWKEKPTANLVGKGEWNTKHILSGIEHGLAGDDWNPGIADNYDRLHPDYWKNSLQERPQPNRTTELAEQGIEPFPKGRDYTHLLPEGYEFCEEEQAEKWVKVEMGKESPIRKVGYVWNSPISPCSKYYRPIRPIQYHVAVHESVTAEPDPYQVDWSKAPEGTVGHAYDKNTEGIWYMLNPEDYQFWKNHSKSGLTLPSGLDWKQSLRVNPKLK